MNGPRIQNDDRGITLNKSLGWTIAVALVVGGIWIGSKVTNAENGLNDLAARMENREARWDARDQQSQVAREQMDSRLRQLESSRATDGAEIGALRRDLTEFRTDVRELTGLLRRLENRYGATP